MPEKPSRRDPKKRKRHQHEYYLKRKQMEKEEEREYCYDPQGGGRKSVSVRENRRNQYWRDQRAEVRRARVRSELRLVGPEVFLRSPQLLQQVKSWIDIAGIAYARKSLSETGVVDSSIDKIIQAAQELTLLRSITKR